MLRSLTNSFSGMGAVLERIDTISNHIANVNTPGFKRKDSVFQTMLDQNMKQPNKFIKNDRLTPSGLNVGNGVRLGRDILQFTQGNLTQTGNTYDLALEGDALFEIATSRKFPDGTIDTQTRYTRDGAFRLTTQPGDLDNQYLVTQDGYFVRDVNDQPVRLPKGAKISFQTDGRVFASTENETTEVGQLKILRVLRPQMLENAGGNMYKLTPEAANVPEQILARFNGNVPDTSQITLHQGTIEMSNVDLTTEMSELLVMQRALSLNARALQTADQMMNAQNNLRG